MEELIAKLLVSDSDVIKNATAELKEVIKRPESTLELCKIATNKAAQVQIRQYATVLLRKHLGKLRNWQNIPVDQQKSIQEGMLFALLHEEQKPVRNGLALFVGCLLRHEPETIDSWIVEILHTICTYVNSNNQENNELGSFLFSTLTDSAPDQFIPHFPVICEMVTHVLTTSDNYVMLTSPTVYNIIIGMNNLVPFILGHNCVEHTYQKCIPVILKTLQITASENNAEKFAKMFSLFDNMADFTPKLLTTNIQGLLKFCLENSSNSQLDSLIRVKTVAYIGWLVRLKKKVIVKNKLLEPIIQVIFNVMATEPVTEEDDEDYFIGEDGSSPMTAATQTMDLLALYVPPEKLIPPLLQLLETSLRGSEPLPRKAAYLCIAVIAEGCSSSICSKYLETMVNIIRVGILDPNPIVRNAAFFALGQFSEHLQPDICKFAPVILPILFDYLAKLCAELRNSNSDPKYIHRMFYALETFCENLEDDLVPHLPLLMERLFEAIAPENSIPLRQLALSAFAAAANAVKSNMLPYFPRLVEALRMYTSVPLEGAQTDLLVEAIDTFAALARTIGKDHFMPLATDLMLYILDLLEKSDEPDLRRACYNLISSVAAIVNEGMETIYPRIIDRMLKTITSTEEVISEYTQENLEANNDEEEIDLMNSDDEDDEFDNLVGYSVENAYLDEKEEAILSMKEFALHTGAAFQPYIQNAFEQIYKTLEHPSEDIRKVSIETLVAFTIALFHQNNLKGASEASGLLVIKLCHLIHQDTECPVVIAALEGLCDLLKDLKELALPSESHKEVIVANMVDVFLGKVTCQFSDLVSSNDEEEEESEYGDSLIEAAGNILPMLGKALSPEQFSLVFGKVYPAVTNKMRNKKEENVAQRAAAYGIFAESFISLQNHVTTFYTDLLPNFLSGINDANDQVRQNAVFGLGELVLHAQSWSYDSYPQILSALSEAVSKENKPGALDNICGAIARLIINNISLVPLNHVLPVFLEKLPLKEDFDENTAVFRCLRMIYQQNPQVFNEYVEHITSVGVQVLYHKQTVNTEAEENVAHIVNEIRTNYPERYNSVIAGLPNEVVHFMQTYFV